MYVIILKLILNIICAFNDTHNTFFYHRLYRHLIFAIAFLTRINQPVQHCATISTFLSTDRVKFDEVGIEFLSVIEFAVVPVDVELCAVARRYRVGDGAGGAGVLVGAVDDFEDLPSCQRLQHRDCGEGFLTLREVVRLAI